MGGRGVSVVVQNDAMIFVNLSQAPPRYSVDFVAVDGRNATPVILGKTVNGFFLQQVDAGGVAIPASRSDQAWDVTAYAEP